VGRAGERHAVEADLEGVTRGKGELVDNSTEGFSAVATLLPLVPMASTPSTTTSTILADSPLLPSLPPFP
jgi:hypothetical protein